MVCARHSATSGITTYRRDVVVDEGPTAAISPPSARERPSSILKRSGLDRTCRPHLRTVEPDPNQPPLMNPPRGRHDERGGVVPRKFSPRPSDPSRTL